MISFHVRGVPIGIGASKMRTAASVCVFLITILGFYGTQGQLQGISHLRVATGL